MARDSDFLCYLVPQLVHGNRLSRPTAQSDEDVVKFNAVT